MTRSAYIPKLSVVVVFEAGEAAVTQGAVRPVPLYQAIYFTIARQAAVRVGHACVSTNSP
jgi:hypothetical protein